jgi:hypothetical protein
MIKKDMISDKSFSKGFLNKDGSCSCCHYFTSDAFNLLLTKIRMKGTDSKMLRFAKHDIRNKCLLPSQVNEIMLVFMSASYRNEFLTFALSYTYDESNYYAFRGKNPKRLDIYQNPNAMTIYDRLNIHNELHDNWERTNKANVVFVNWLQLSYGSGSNDQINR